MGDDQATDADPKSLKLYVDAEYRSKHAIALQWGNSLTKQDRYVCRVFHSKEKLAV